MQKKGNELVVGDVVLGVTTEARIVAIRPYRVPAAVLHDSVAARNPGGLPGRIIDTAPSCYSFTAFDDDFYEVR